MPAGAVIRAGSGGCGPGLFVALNDDQAAGYQPVTGTPRFDQTAYVLDVARRVRAGERDVRDALIRLDAIDRAPARWPTWLSDLGAVSAGMGICLFLQPNLANVAAAGIGSLIVAGHSALARHRPDLRALLPVATSFLVSAGILGFSVI